ncbi:hypothetical protein AM1BK_09000 [Neobacillus kokaensis]|uniref:Uncharacterized protein n=1 Tax=Neobacillus kokaensis TaxID=2759023 RepID=A0ABQ3N126_9BACI|nr:hypothetical protein AM1BK_09000 [Neobacillus kokaensis]
MKLKYCLPFSALRMNEASASALMWVVPREDTYNPLVPVWDEGFFIFSSKSV